MRTALETRAEIVKLARLLGSEPDELSYLRKLAPNHLRRLRERVTDVLFDAELERFKRVAAASRLLPVPLAASIAERVFGPLLCARTAGLVEPSRAVEMASRQSPAFLADVAVEMDPRRASDVICRMPMERVVDVAREMARREEHVAMGRFVAHLPDEAILATLEVVDDAALLRIAFVLEGKEEELDHVVELLPEERLAGVIQAAAAADLWPEALSLLGHLDERRRGQLADLTARQDEPVLDSLVVAVVGAAEESDLWEEGLRLLTELDPSLQERFVEPASRLPPEQRARAAEQASRLGLLEELGPLRQVLER